MMPEAVQYVCGFVPGTYACALFRYAFMSDTINAMAAYVNNAELMAELTGSFGYNLNFFGYIVTPGYQALALTIFTVLLAALNIVFGKYLTAVTGGMSIKIFSKKEKAAKHSSDAAGGEGSD